MLAKSSSTTVVLFVCVSTVCWSTALAQSIGLKGSTLQITGTSMPDVVLVTAMSANRLSRVPDTLVITYKNSRTSKSLSQSIPLRDSNGRPQISLIHFEGGADSDRFTNSTSLPSFADGGPGNDTLTGGSSSDVFYGGVGDDRLIGNAGDDELYGGYGNDSMEGGAGTDTMLGTDEIEDADSEWRDYDQFKDDFDLSLSFANGASHLDVDQERSNSCTILSSLSSAAYRGIDLQSRVLQSRTDETQFAVMLFNENGTTPLTIAVTFDGTWSSNDASPVRERINGRPIGPMTGEFWPVLFQRAYLNAYVPNWQDEPVDIDNWVRPGGTPGAWGRRGHALRAIVGGVNPGSFSWNDYTVNNSPDPPTAEELAAFLDVGYVLTTTYNGHVVALLDVWFEDNEWFIQVYNQRSLDNYGDEGAIVDALNDGVMTFRFGDYLDTFGVVTPFSSASEQVGRSWRYALVYYARF